MKRRTFGLPLMLLLVWIVACEIPPLALNSTPTITPDRIATRVAGTETAVAEETAVAATLIAKGVRVTQIPSPTQSMPASSTPTPISPTSPPTQSSKQIVPTATQTARPPTAPTSTSSTGMTGTLTGKLVGKKTKQPIVGATVVLCAVMPIENQTKCELQTDMTATSNQDGSLSLAKIPAGTYVVVYSMSKDADPNSWKGLTVQFGIIPAKSPGARVGDMIPDPFGGSLGITAEGTMYNVYNDKDMNFAGVIMGNGFVKSNTYGLVLEFVDSKAVMVQIEGDKTTGVEIQVTGR